MAAVACETPAPSACTDMCGSAAALYGGCLEDWGVDWSAAGYEDEDQFLASCATWIWEMSLLEADALERGEIEQEGWLGPVCAERHAAFSAEDATCEAYTGVDWNDTPWQAPEETTDG